MIGFDTFEETGHAALAPSAADGWMVCADYLNANRGKPDTAGIDAAQGTRFHQLMEHCLLNPWFKPYQWLGQEEIIEAGGKEFLVAVDQEMVDSAIACLKWVEGLEGLLYVEQKVDFSDLTPLENQKGTCDYARCKPGVLRIRDWKYGKGVWVNAEKNRQLRLYAYGFFREWDWLYDFETIEIGVGQPRLNNFDVWTITRAELLAFAENEVRPAATKAVLPNQTRTPTEKGCRWCKDVACAARLLMLEHLTDDVFEDLDTISFTAEEIREVATRPPMSSLGELPLPAELSTERLSFIVRHRKMFESWFKASHEELVARAEAGDIAPDMKLVEARTKMAIGNKEEFVDILRKSGVPDAEIYVRRLTSPAKAAESLRRHAKMTKKGALSMLGPVVFKPPGKHTLVHASDNREAVKGLAEDSFENLDVSDL